MSSFISLPIRQLVCALKTRPEAVRSCEAAANAWLASCLESLELVRPLVLWSAATDELFNQAQLDLKESLRLIADPLNFAEDKADPIWAAVMRYYGQLFQLQAHELKRPAFSPILALDQLIKVTFNVLQGRCPNFELQTRFPLAHAEVVSLRAQWGLRQRLFAEVEWPSAIDDYLSQIEGGLGAIAHYLELGNPIQLEEAIQLIGKGSSDYALQLQNLEMEVKSRHRFSHHDAIEHWLRLQEHPFDLGESVTRQAWDRLFQEVDDYLRTLQAAQRAGLSVAQPELMAAAAQVHQQAFDQLALVAAQPYPAAAVAELLNFAWEQMDRGRGAVQFALADVQRHFGGAPRILELLEILGQSAAGLLPSWVLKDELNQRLQEQQASLKALREAPPAPESIAPMLDSHQQAYQRMLAYCQDDQVEHLVEGWKLLSLTMPPLLAFEANLRRDLAHKGKSGQQLTCVRCGHVQKPQKVCAQCGGSMPQYQVEDVSYELVAGDASRDKVSPADQLADLVQGLTFGVSSWENIKQEILRQLDTLAKTRDQFEKDMVKLMGTENSLDVYCQFFVVRLGQLSQALIDLGKAADSRDIGVLKGGFSSYRQLHEELVEFQKRIAEGIGKTS